MAIAYKNFGPCVVSVGTGAANAQESLGIAEKGGRITLDFKDRPIHDDAGGPDCPVELQTMLSMAFVDVDLQRWDQTILDKLLVAAEAGAGAAGVAGNPGALLGTGGFLKILYLPSSIGTPWTFQAAKLEPASKTEGTEYSPLRLRFKCIRFLAGSVLTANTVALYTRVAPP